MDDISDNENQISYIQKLNNEKSYYTTTHSTGEGTSNNNNREDHQQLTNDLHTINRAFDDCRVLNQHYNIRKESSLFWNPENKCFEVRHYYLPKFKEKNFRRDEYFQKITNINEQLIRSTSFRNNPRYNNYADPKFKAKFKKYKMVSFNPEVEVIYMIKKRSNNEVHLKGVEVLNKEQDQQMRNYIMRSTYSKKKTLLY